MRLPALGLVAFAAALALLGTPAAPGSDVARPEAHHLLVAESIVSDGDLDVADEFARRAYAPFLAGGLEPSARPTDGRLHEPQGAGFGLLVAPAYAAGGVRAVQVALAAVLALAAMAAAALARRIVPEPWATTGAALVAPLPARARRGRRGAARPARGDAHRRRCARGRAGAARGPGAARWPPSRARPRSPSCRGSGPQYLLPAAPVAVALVRWTRAAGRPVAGLLAGEAVSARSCSGRRSTTASTAA